MMDLKVAYIGDENTVSFELGETGQIAVGVEKLGQDVIKILMTDTGTSSSMPSLGGNIKRLTKGTPTDSESISAIRSSITSNIMLCERFIKDSQSTEDVPDEESLDSIIIASIDYDKSLAMWDIRLIVKNKSNSYYPIDLGGQNV